MACVSAFVKATRPSFLHAILLSFFRLLCVRLIFVLFFVVVDGRGEGLFSIVNDALSK